MKVRGGRYGNWDGAPGGMAIMIKVEAEGALIGIKRHIVNAARAERAVSG